MARTTEHISWHLSIGRYLANEEESRITHIAHEEGHHAPTVYSGGTGYSADKDGLVEVLAGADCNDSVTVRMKFMAPVWVVVDIDAGTVDSVTVDDQGLEHPTGFWYDDERLAADEVGVRHQGLAKQIAEDCEWPTWDVG